MIKIGILEDEEAQSDKLQQFLARYQDTHPEFSYTATVFDTGSKLIFGYTMDYDLLFMDIRLPDMLGIDAATRIRSMDAGVMIVFVTNLTQYAIAGYSVNAYDYILKPLLYSAFEVKLGRILNVLSHQHNKNWLTLKTKQTTFRVEKSSILYVEVDGHDLIFHTDHEDYHIWGTLSRYEKELGEGLFSRCNACYLVNLNYVQSVRGYTVMVKGIELAISRPRRKEFLSDLARYKGGSV